MRLARTTHSIYFEGQANLLLILALYNYNHLTINDENHKRNIKNESCSSLFD